MFHNLIFDPHTNGFISFLFSALALLTLLTIIPRQLCQFEIRRMLWFKGALLAMTTLAILLSLPSMFLQIEKAITGSYSLNHAYITSLSNAVSRFTLALCLAIMYFKKEKE